MIPAALCTACLVLLLVPAILDAPLRRRRIRKAVATLADKSCPNCGTPFGPAAAHDAFNPPPGDLIDDEFPGLSVACPACRAVSSYHSACGTLVLSRPHRPFPPAVARARRIGSVTEREVLDLVLAGPVRFVIEETGQPFRPVPRRQAARFWEWRVRGHVADYFGNPAHFRGGYLYFAEWWHDGGDPIILLHVTKASPDPDGYEYVPRHTRVPSRFRKPTDSGRPAAHAGS